MRRFRIFIGGSVGGIIFSREMGGGGSYRSYGNCIGNYILVLPWKGSESIIHTKLLHAVIHDMNVFAIRHEHISDRNSQATHLYIHVHFLQDLLSLFIF